MLPDNNEVLALPELLDLLVKNTMQMLDARRQKEVDLTVMREIKKDVQLIQSAISTKKSENAFSPIM